MKSKSDRNGGGNESDASDTTPKNGKHSSRAHRTDDEDDDDLDSTASDDRSRSHSHDSARKERRSGPNLVFCNMKYTFYGSISNT